MFSLCLNETVIDEVGSAVKSTFLSTGPYITGTIKIFYITVNINITVIRLDNHFTAFGELNMCMDSLY